MDLEDDLFEIVQLLGISVFARQQCDGDIAA
jgi:hypothetical protein